ACWYTSEPASSPLKSACIPLLPTVAAKARAGGTPAAERPGHSITTIAAARLHRAATPRTGRPLAARPLDAEPLENALAATRVISRHPLIRHHSPVFQADDAVYMLPQPRIVRGKEERNAPLRVELLHEFDQGESRFRVQVGRGLVRQDHAGLGRQGPGHRHPLLLAAGELVG